MYYITFLGVYRPMKFTLKSDTVVAKIDENRCKQTLASLSCFWAYSWSQFIVIMTYHRILQMHVVVNSSSLPVYKKDRIASLLSIFETSVSQDGQLYIFNGVRLKFQKLLYFSV